MKKQSFITKVLALSMALFMLFSMFPVSAADAPGNSETPTVESSDNVTDENGSSENTGDATEIVPAETQTSEPETTGTGEGEEPTPTEGVDTPTDAPTEEPTQAPTEEPKQEPCIEDGSILYEFSNEPNALGCNSDLTIFKALTKIIITIPKDSNINKEPEVLFSADENDTKWWSRNIERKEVTYKEQPAYKITLNVSDQNRSVTTGSYQEFFVRIKYGENKYKRSVTIDKAAPSCSVVLYDNNWANANTDYKITFNGFTENCPNYTAYLVDANNNEAATTLYNTDTKNPYILIKGTTYQVIKIRDEVGNVYSHTLDYQDMKIDADKPTISVTSAKKWSNDPIKLTIQVSDDKSGINKDSFKLDGENIVVEEIPGNYIYTIEKPTKAKYTLSVSDNAGNEATKEFEVKYDDAAPKAEDITVDLSVEETAAEKIFNLLSFGFYTNQKIAVTVSVNSNGFAPINEISLKDGDTDIISSKGIEEDGNIYSKKFTLNHKDTTYKLTLAAKDAAGNGGEFINLADVSAITVNKAAAESFAKEYKEIISNAAIPQIEKVTAKVTTDGEYTKTDDVFVMSETGEAKVNFTVSDYISGLNLKELKLYFGEISQFTEKDGEYIPSSKMEPVAVGTSENATANEAIPEKVDSASVSYVAKIADVKTYVITLVTENNCCNRAVYSFVFAVDQKSPTITIAELSEDWSNESIKVYFDVTDQPEKYNFGVDVPSITVTGEDDKKEYQVKTDENGKTYFVADKCQRYTIKAKDTFHSKDEDASNETTDKIKYDNDPPAKIANLQFTNSEGKNDWTAGNIKVSFTTADATSEIKVEVVGANGVPYDVTKEDVTIDGASVYTFIADEKQDYAITVTDQAGNFVTKDIPKEDIKICGEPAVFTAIEFVEINNGREFGAYSNKDVIVTITAKQVGFAEITSIDLKNETETGTIEKVGKLTTDAKDSTLYYQSFVVKPSKDKGYNLVVTITTASNVKTVQNDYNGVEITMNGDIKGDNSKLFEFVVTKNAPNFNITINGGCNEDKTLYHGELDAIVNVTDSLSPVDKVKIYFDDKEVYSTTVAEKEKLNEVKTTYTISADTESGNHEIKVVAKNLSGNISEVTQDITIDNTAPVIDNISFSDQWSNEAVDVDYTVVDAGVGVEKIEVIGSLEPNDKTTYSPSAINDEGKYSFESKKCQTYKIIATDKFGNEAVYGDVDEEKLQTLYDAQKPVVENITYKNDQNKKWVNEDVRITFTINDRNSDEEAVSGIDYNSVVVTGTEKDEEGAVTTYRVFEEPYEEGELDETYRTFWFDADRYDEYVIKAADTAGNITTFDKDGKEVDYKTEPVKIDRTPAEITKVKFEQDPKAVGKILSFLTFGIYHSNNIVVTVEAEDNASGVDSITTNVVSDPKKDIKLDKDGKKATAVFTINKKDENILSISSNDLKLTVTDNATNKKDNTLTSVKDVIETDGKVKWDDEFELAIYGNYKGTGMGNLWFTDKHNNPINKYHPTSDAYANFNLSWVDDNGKPKTIHQAIVKLNGDDISTHCNYFVGNGEATDDQIDILSNSKAIFTHVAKHTGTKVTDFNIKVDLSKEEIKDSVRLSSSSKTPEGAENQFTVTLIDNAGLEYTTNFTTFLVIDDVKPVVTSIELSKTNPLAPAPTESSNKPAETAKPTKAKLHSDKVKFDENGEPSSVLETDYGYYFVNKTYITVNATDYLSDGKEVAGSGVKAVYLTGTSAFNKSENFSTMVTLGDEYFELDEKTGAVTARFVVKKGFKGTIHAYVVDNVDNMSYIYNPDNTVVENEEIHNSTSSASVSIDLKNNKDNYVGKDNNGHKLFNGSVKAKIEIEDTYSGLKDVTYTIKAIGFGGKTAKVLENGKLTSADSKWDPTYDKINNYQTNLVTKLNRTITLTPQAYNYNSIQVVVNGVDNAGYKIEAKSELFSIDTVAPQIKIDYNNVSGNTDRDGKTYYKDTRIATVTVTERNFDPDDFDWSGVVNGHGSPVPRAEGTSNWSTNYSDFTDNSTHTAILTFSQDGDYSIDLAFEDMATNSATQKGEEFTIDTIDPVVSVTYDNNNARNGKYYAQGRTATIRVEEHNFDPSDVYVTYTPRATGPDNSTSATPPTISWGSPSGDVCTGTIVFDRNGSYQFTLRVKDKSLRESTEFTQEEFVVDTYIGTVENEKDSSIEFNNVKNESAYAGEIRPQVVFSDYNYDDSTLELRKISYDYKTKKSVEVNASHLIPHAVSSSFGVTYSFANFPVDEKNDGIYILTATVIDKAGNPHDRKIMFSVNRFGSTFMLGDKKSEKLVDNVYTNDAPDLSVIEINVNPVTAQKVTLSKNTTSEELEKGKQFSIGSEGNKDSWYKYTYTIDKSNFDDEGDYTVTVSSEDKDGNVVSNRTAQTKKRNCPVSFIVDKTKPVVSIEGLEEGYTKEASQTVRISCLDANLDKDSLVITKNGKVLKLDEDYTIDDLVGELTAEFTLKSEGGQSEYDIEVSVKDYANNENGDRKDDYIINATLLTQYLNSPLAIILTFVLLAAVAAIIILIARKKKKEE